MCWLYEEKTSQTIGYDMKQSNSHVQFSHPQEHNPVEADESRQPRHLDQLVSQPGENRHQDIIIIFISNITIITMIITATCAGQHHHQH